MHTIAGIIVAPLLLVAAITGLAYACAPTLEKLVYADELTATSGLPAQSLERQVAAAQQVHPDLPVSAVQVPEDERTTTRVLFTDSGLPSKSYRHAVFVDPGDLSIKGELVQYGSASALPLRTWLSEAHKHLRMGTIGRIYSETAASWMGALTIGGLWLWWDRSRRNRTNGRSIRAHRMRRHANVGVLLTLGLLFLTVTGLTWSMYAGKGIAALRAELNWLAPTPEVATSQTVEWSWAESDRVLHTARQSHLQGTLEITPPGKGSAWVASETREEWRLKKDAVSVNGSTGDVVDSVRFSEWPLAAQLTHWAITLHMGILFGWVNQLVLLLLMVGLIAMVVRGYQMWCGRGRAGRPGTLPGPVRWRDVHPGVTAAVVLAVVAYSIIAPLFGVTLVLFTLFDLTLRKLRRRLH